MNKRKIRIIVVDDENRIRRGIERLIMSCGEEYEIVGSFKNGLELIKSIQMEKIDFDLLFTDIKMPGMDGLELIKELKNWASFEAVVISGFSDFKYLQTALREGAIDYMVKPLLREEFRKQLGKIKGKIIRKWTEEEKIEEMDSELNFVKQVQRLSELIRGQDIDLSEMEWTRGFPIGSYFLLCISKDHISNVKQTAISENWTTFVETEINSILTNFYKETATRFWYWKGEEFSCWVLIQNDRCEELQESLLAEQLRAKIKYDYQQSATIAISNEFHDVALLPNMRDDLLSLLQFRLIYGGNQVYTYTIMEKKLLEREKVKESKELDRTITKILNSLERFQKEETFELLYQFLKELGRLNSPQEIDRNIQSLSIQTVNFLLRNARAKDEVFLIQEGLQLTKKSANFLELKKKITGWIQKVFNVLDRLNQRELVDPVETAKKWILNNLGENITIDKIARKIHMNPTYFCEYFKSQTGDTILDYVTKVRLEKAKVLLIDTDLKIYDISQFVGYSDTKYFSKLFKKYFGDVPSKFKEKAKNNA
ncbi:response regulator transcription factor [Neobacillus drentensis]|uniref:response regulator transcription factor n=1 Tax=Neobacillus drentensis TaxID=220684 RepID=UPI002FFD9E67